MNPNPRHSSMSGSAPPPPETLGVVRDNVRQLLLKSDAFRALPFDQQRQIAHDTVAVATYLAAPEGIEGNKLPPPRAAPERKKDAYEFGLAQDSTTKPPLKTQTSAPGQFTAQAASEGARVTGAYLAAVDFPTFVSGLIEGVFHSIVKSSIEQMEAYGKLVADVAQSLNQFRDQNVSSNQGKDYLVEQYPDTFKLDIDTGEDGGAMPRIRLRDGVDESAALKKVSSLPVEGGPVTSLDDDTIEEKLVPAARTQLATSRQQLLATMVLMGINRIVVTDGRIAAKVMFDFTARDNFNSRTSATTFDYGNQYRYASEGDYEKTTEGGDASSSYTKDKGWESQKRDASYYSKGTYKNTAEPVLKLMSATQASTDAALSAKASLSGQVEVNFKSETFPLEKMADSFQIGRIQDAAKPGAASPARTAATSPATTTPATPPAAPAAKP
ncbi:MAG TPA: hypothetical protein VGC89_11805 [Pyrinomonadaceae bacterium]|jgi:hypothetical protein